ncbi:hydrolase of the alpha/beta superfamily [Lysobacter dokdonensis DS-58]|uniref:Hydrolase of the alpha/beta superfamily n=1 Tax=Lysobacter dokdonensis DS-58 TaxID=1300345 RepID=A0A0A2WGX4_9GAMM|nr:alpha/beta fold hydrolase [Lysobacter dokdonensis]KGQ19023.1 hydrolase of the alpha/beta superfamily [Lysobacter dokdonensis DS-58]
MKLRKPVVISLMAAAPVLAYAGLCGWMYAKQRDLLYLPQTTKADPNETDFGIARNGVMLNGWLVNIGQPGAVVYFGGNAERIEDRKADFARLFPDASTYLVPYRGYGASEGKPTEADILEDALAVYDQVQARQPGARIVVIGRSLGSAVASYVASKRPVAKLVLVTPFDSMANVAQAHYPWLPVRWILQDKYEQATYLRAYKGPLLIVRAGRDDVVPPASTDQLIASLRNKAEVLNLPNADHSSVSASTTYARTLAAFVGTP